MRLDALDLHDLVARTVAGDDPDAVSGDAEHGAEEPDERLVRASALRCRCDPHPPPVAVRSDDLGSSGTRSDDDRETHESR
jgi:hypothetical protein